MKKFHLVSGARRAGKAALALTLAVAMSVPNTSLFSLSAATEVETEAAELPTPVQTVDFEQGFAGEKAENDLSVVESEPVLTFKEDTNDDGTYKVDSEGNVIFALTDTPFIENNDYKKSVSGNQPTTYYDGTVVTDGAITRVGFGNVLMLDDTVETPEFIKSESDELDERYPVGTVLQEAVTSHSAVEIRNPFAGLDLSEEPTISEDGATWNGGVTISYWVYVPEGTDEDGNALDSVLLTFQNESDEDVYVLDDWIKYEAVQNYSADDPQYALGTRETLTDDNTGAQYTVASDYGPLVRMNPDYEGSATNKIYYVTTETSKMEVSIRVNGATVMLDEIGANLTKDFGTLNIDEGSLVKRGHIQGSMQIAASNTFHFREDNYWTQDIRDENGNLIETLILAGAKQLNPNHVETYDKVVQFRAYNQLMFVGDGTVTKNPGQWHYVTCVIQNDWVSFFVDGLEIYEDQWAYFDQGQGSFSMQNAGKYFNMGYGLRAPYNFANGIADWSSDGTCANGPANGYARTMIDWLTDEDTKLYIGNQGCAAGAMMQEIGTTDGVLLDDLTFYTEPVDADQAAAMYENALQDKKVTVGDDGSLTATDELTTLPSPLKVFDFTDDSIGSIPAGMASVASNDAENLPEVVNYENVGHVLKAYRGTARATSAVSYDNPFKGMTDLEGVTISYWVKSATLGANDDPMDSIGVTFVDEPKILTHSKIQEASKDIETRTALYIKNSTDTNFIAGYDSVVQDSLKNMYKFSTLRNGNYDPSSQAYEEESKVQKDAWDARLQGSTEGWHLVTMVATNAGIQMYYDGEKLSNNLTDTLGPSYYGPRFYDGYYVRVLDGFAPYKLASMNQGTTPLMTFLAQEDTTAYINYVHQLKNSRTYQSGATAYYDDITFYDVALNDAQISTLYAQQNEAQNAKTTVEGEEVEVDNGQGSTTTPTPSPDDPTPPVDQTESGSFTQNADGTYTATVNGVKITVAEGVIADVLNATVTVTVLGTESNASTYAEADSKLATISGLSIGKRVLYNISVTVGGQEVTLNGNADIELTPISGYTATRCSVVRMADSTVLETSVAGSALAFATNTLGNFAVVEAKEGDAVAGNQGATNTVSGTSGNTTGGSTASGSTTSGSANAGKTGDTANVAIPVMILLVAGAVVVLAARKRRVSE